MVETLEFKNYIGGKEVLLSGRQFSVESEFYPKYITKVPDSSLFDIKTAISKAKSARDEARKIPLDERKKILKKASEKISFAKTDIEYIVKNTGMPISRVNELTIDIKSTYLALPKLLEDRIGERNGKFVQRISKNSNLLAIFEPINGFIYAITPGNDIRVTPFIVSWIVELGLTGIIKCSKTDMVASQKAVKAVVEAGYPEGALSVVCWDTSKKENEKLNFELVDAAKAVWAYGDDKTVDQLIRFEEKEGGQIKDHFSDKIVLRHATGRSAGVCDDTIEIKEITEKIIKSSLLWPIGCNSLKMVFDATGDTELELSLTEQFKKLGKYVGDPMKQKTQVGLTSPILLNHIWNRINDLKRMGLIERKVGKRLGEKQTEPILLETKDPNSEFLNTEFSTYILTLKKCKNLNEAILEANEAAGIKQRLAVSVFTHKDEDIMNKYIHSHHIRPRGLTTEIDLLFHEGNDYFHKLTIPQIHRTTNNTGW